MEVAYKDIKSADSVLKTLLKTPQDPKFSYRMGKMLKKFVPVLEKLDEEGNALVRKHGTLENGRYNVAPDKMEEFSKEFVEFLAGTLEIEFEKIPFEMIEQSKIKISPEDMLALDQFITEPEADAVAG